MSTLCESAVNDFEITAVSLPRSGLLFMPRGLKSLLLFLEANRIFLFDDVHNVHPVVKQKAFPWCPWIRFTDESRDNLIRILHNFEIPTMLLGGKVN